jgi:hypothetical protein
MVAPHFVHNLRPQALSDMAAAFAGYAIETNGVHGAIADAAEAALLRWLPKDEVDQGSAAGTTTTTTTTSSGSGSGGGRQGEDAVVAAAGPGDTMTEFTAPQFERLLACLLARPRGDVDLTSLLGTVQVGWVEFLWGGWGCTCQRVSYATSADAAAQSTHAHSTHTTTQYSHQPPDLSRNSSLPVPSNRASCHPPSPPPSCTHCRAGPRRRLPSMWQPSSRRLRQRCRTSRLGVWSPCSGPCTTPRRRCRLRPSMR